METTTASLVVEEGKEDKILLTTEKDMSIKEAQTNLENAKKNLDNWKQRSQRIESGMQAEVDKWNKVLEESGIKEEPPIETPIIPFEPIK